MKNDVGVTVAFTKVLNLIIRAGSLFRIVFHINNVEYGKREQLKLKTKANLGSFKEFNDGYFGFFAAKKKLSN